jgi:hypothetical protein
VHHADSSLLELLLAQGKASPETYARAYKELSTLPSSPMKATKLQSILQRSKQKDHISALLVQEVHSLLQAPPEDRVLSIAKTLLAAGADINAHNAAALCHAIAGCNTQVTELLLTAKPHPMSLAYALPHALRISDPMDRLASAQKLLEAGAPGAEVNRALVFAIGAYGDDIPLLNTLSSKADMSDGEALLIAVKKQNVDITEVILNRRKHPVGLLNTAFANATMDKNKETRMKICMPLLRAGVSGTVVSEALLAAAADGDIELGKILIDHGASVEDKDGQAIIEACRSGAVGVLSMLLGGKTATKLATLERGFQAATEVGDLKKRAAIFGLLLEKGVNGAVVDSQLVSAVRFGADGEELVKILVQAGADPDYNNGEAIWTATCSIFLRSLKMLLGIMNVGGQQVCTDINNAK